MFHNNKTEARNSLSEFGNTLLGHFILEIKL